MDDNQDANKEKDANDNQDTSFFAFGTLCFGLLAPSIFFLVLLLLVFSLLVFLPSGLLFLVFLTPCAISPVFLLLVLPLVIFFSSFLFFSTFLFFFSFLFASFFVFLLVQIWCYFQPRYQCLLLLCYSYLFLSNESFQSYLSTIGSRLCDLTFYYLSKNI